MVFFDSGLVVGLDVLILFVREELLRLLREVSEFLKGLLRVFNSRMVWVGK